MISFALENKQFRVLRDGKPVFTVAQGASVAEVANIDANYKMSRGSFVLKEKVIGRRPLFVVDMQTTDDGVLLVLDEGKLKIETQYGGERIRVTPVGLAVYDRLYLCVDAAKDESVYGTGETFSEFDLRGCKSDVWVSEHINAMQIARKVLRIATKTKRDNKKKKFESYASYYVQPTFLSSRKYFFHSDATTISRFDFTSDTEHKIQIDPAAPFYFGFGDTFEAVLENLTDLIGRQIMLPDWVHDGEILGVQGGTAIMDKKLKTALDHDMAVAGVWIQDWEGRRVTAVGKQLYWNWVWDEELYPELNKRIKEYAAKGVKILGEASVRAAQRLLLITHSYLDAAVLTVHLAVSHLRDEIPLLGGVVQTHGTALDGTHTVVDNLDARVLLVVEPAVKTVAEDQHIHPLPLESFSCKSCALLTEGTASSTKRNMITCFIFIWNLCMFNYDVVTLE